MSGLRSIRNYSFEFKMLVIEEVLSGEISKEAASRKYGIKGHSTISKWIRKFGHNTMPMSLPEKADLKERIKELEKLLEYERLKRVAYEEMIKIAERELKISIRKKSDSKQSKK